MVIVIMTLQRVDASGIRSTVAGSSKLSLIHISNREMSSKVAIPALQEALAFLDPEPEYDKLKAGAASVVPFFIPADDMRRRLEYCRQGTRR
jgi:hypothetical protein